LLTWAVWWQAPPRRREECTSSCLVQERKSYTTLRKVHTKAIFLSVSPKGLILDLFVSVSPKGHKKAIFLAA
jgi:hypothetical protein